MNVLSKLAMLVANIPQLSAVQNVILGYAIPAISE
jgi:hypothetical protein